MAKGASIETARMPPSCLPLAVSLPFLAFLVVLQTIQLLYFVTIHGDSVPRTLSINDFLEAPTKNNNDGIGSIFHDQKYCLIHVGKAAGSKISCELGYSYAPECRPYNDTGLPQSALQQHRGGVRHMGLKLDCTPQTNDAKVFIVTLRHPVHRLVSWHNYEHIYNRRIQQNPKVKRKKSCLNQFHNFKDSKGCFLSLSDFAAHTLPSSNNKCQQLAWGVASGEIPCMWHNAMGYSYYRNVIEKVTSIESLHLLAMRAEHLQEDWDSLEQMFGGRLTNSTNFESALNKSKKPAQNLSQEGMRNLCRALCREIQVYKDFLFRAKNLNATQRQESIAELLHVCPEEKADIQSCHMYETFQVDVLGAMKTAPS